MKKAFRITGKIILWVAGSLIGLFVLVVILINIPSVQNFILRKVTTSVSDKTHSTVSIGHINISFPEKVVLTDVYLDDRQKDTLLFAGEIKADVGLFGLISGNIEINSLSLENLTVNLKRKAGEDKFNYSFIPESFASAKPKDSVMTDSSKSKFSVSRITLVNSRFVFDDANAGNKVSSSFDKLEIAIDKMNADSLHFNINKILISGGDFFLSLSDSRDTAVKPPGMQPLIEIKDFELEKIKLTYMNPGQRQSIRLATDNISLTGIFADAGKSIYSLDHFNSVHTIASVIMPVSKAHPSETISSSPSQPVSISVAGVSVEDNSFRYSVSEGPGNKNSFDAGHMEFNSFNMKAANIAFNDSVVQSDINLLSFIDGNNFELKSLTASAKYSSKKTSVTGFNLETKYSGLSGNFNFDYPSPDALKNHIEKIIAGIDLAPSHIGIKDVLYFVPALGKNPLLAAGNNINLQGKIFGPLGRLNGEKIKIAVGKNTSINIASFFIAGLPDVKKARFVIPSFGLVADKNDYAFLLTPAMMKSFSPPMLMHVKGNFTGTMKLFTTKLAMTSSSGNLDADVSMPADKQYDISLSTHDLDLGKLLNQPGVLGPVTLNAKVKGKGYAMEEINADVNISAEKFVLNKYQYENFLLEGTFSDQTFEGSSSIKDKNLEFNFKGLAGLKDGDQKFKFGFDLLGANLKNLGFTDRDIRVASEMSADVKGKNYDGLYGTAGIRKIIIVKDEKIYKLDSVLYASVNDSGKTNLDIQSAIFGAKFNGKFVPGKLGKELMSQVNKYFGMSDTLRSQGGENDFTFEIKIRNNPVISEVFLPALREMEPVNLSGSFDSKSNNLSLNGSIPLLNLNNIIVKNGTLAVSSDAAKLDYSIKADDIGLGQMEVKALNVSGELKDNAATVSLRSGLKEEGRELALDAVINSKGDDSYELKIADNITLNSEPWKGDSNFISISKNTSPLIHFTLAKETQSLVFDAKENMMKLGIRNFELYNLSHLVQNDTSLIEGRLNGDLNKDASGLSADIQLAGLSIREIPVGDLSIKAVNNSPGRFNIDAGLSQNDNDVKVTGEINTGNNESSMDLRLMISRLSMKSIEAFSFGQLRESSGAVNGQLACTGTFSSPEINGNLKFDNVSTIPVALGNKAVLRSENIEVKNSSLHFNSFTIRDEEDHSFVLNGDITNLSAPEFNLDINTDDYKVLDKKERGESLYAGSVILDSKIKLRGTLDFPVVDADVRVKKGSDLTFAIPDKALTTDKGEGVVEFRVPVTNPILTDSLGKKNEKSEFKNLDVDAEITIDNGATLKILVDPVSGDSLVVKGSASLSFTLDPSGKVSLTGRYDLNDGSYVVSLEDLLKKKFEIQKGSSIEWNGDPMDANVDINAVYEVRTSPIDLVAGQISGLSEAEQNSYKERLPFNVLLHLKGQLLTPEISFEIQLPTDKQGTLGGAVNAKLALLNQDPSELNKQVFALLVLGRFVQEDPLVSSGGSSGAEGIARSSVSRFLSQQLNKWAENYIHGVEINLDVQSYDDFSTGTTEGRTEVELGLKKQFNERVSVQVGGSLDVEGERAKQNNLSDLTGDILIEYKLTDDGRYRLKGFRRNEFEGVIEGQLVETGVGFVFLRDFDRWKDLFKKPENDNSLPSSTDK